MTIFFHFEFVFAPTQDLKQIKFQLLFIDGEVSDVFAKEEFYFEVSGSFVEWKL